LPLDWADKSMYSSTVHRATLASPSPIVQHEADVRLVTHSSAAFIATIKRPWTLENVVKPELENTTAPFTSTTLTDGNITSQAPGVLIGIYNEEIVLL
jgi:hypothetical protein